MGLPTFKSEEGGDDVKSSWPLCPGLHTCYNGGDSGKLGRETMLISKSHLSSDCTLQLGCMKVESLVIAEQQAAVNTFPGLVHTARHGMGVGSTLRRCANPQGMHSSKTAFDKKEEGGDDVKSSWPLCPGLHTCYNGRYKPLQTREGELIGKSRPQFGLESATRLHEAGIASNRGSACHGEYVPGPCTHRPSHHESGLH